MAAERASVSAVIQVPGYPDSCPGPYPWWATNTAGQPGNRVVMQSDGNLVLYRADNSVAWASDTTGSAAIYLNVRDTGGVVLQGSDGSVAATLSGTHQTHLPVRAVHHDVRSAVEHHVLRALVRLPVTPAAAGRRQPRFVRAGYRLLWSTHIYRTGADHLMMQDDSNLVLYLDDGTAVWASGTSSSPGAGLSLQNGGNLVIYNTADQAVWATWTQGQLRHHDEDGVAGSGR